MPLKPPRETPQNPREWARWARSQDVGGDVSGALADHIAAADPHPVYATDADLTAHALDADPHPVYAKDTDLTTVQASLAALALDYAFFLGV